MDIDEIVAKACPLNDTCPAKKMQAAQRRVELKQRILQLIAQTANFTETELNEFLTTHNPEHL